MKIIRIEWRNFGSYGNKKQVIELPEEPKLFQIIGNNGAGKTTMANVISFCLYGKVEGKNLSELPNRINGNAWTKMEFETGSKRVIVERGYDPSIFNITVNGIPWEQFGKSTAQDYLTDELLGIPYKVFNNTISLSINDFKSFVKMTPTDKRMIVDKIFGFYVLNQMREVLKGQNKVIKEELDKINIGLNSVLRSIEKTNIEIESLFNSIKEKSKIDINTFQDSLDKFNKLREIHFQKLEEFRKEESEFNNLFDQTNRKLIENKKDYSDLERRLKLYNNSKCPTCEVNLDSDFHISLKKDIEEERNKKDDLIKETEIIINQMGIKRSEFIENKRNLEDKGNKINLKIIELNKEIQKINDSKGDSQLESLKKITNDLEKDRDEFESKLDKNTDKINWINKLDSIIGVGVKMMAIKSILPSLNSEINSLLKEMGLPFNISFDDDFNCVLSQMGAKIPTSTLSVGEMKKVDFIVLISIIKLIKIKFNKLNLLFLDEIFSSIDPEGMFEIMRILKTSSKEMGLNILVMNFAPMPSEFFDYKINVKKQNMFSSVSIEGF